MKKSKNVNKIVLNVICVVTIVIAIIVAYVKRSVWEGCSVEKCDIPHKALKYWPICKRMWNKKDNLKTMKRVFDRLGYQRVDGNKTE